MTEKAVVPDFDSNIADVVIYARYSSEKQNDQSIEGQLKYCHDYAAQHGFRVVGEYIDRAVSGTKADHRIDFQRMIADARKRQFKYVLVWKLDRFARNRYDSAIYKNELKKYGIRVLSVTEGIGEGSESIILEAVLEAMAEEYSRQLSQNVRRGMMQNAQKGISVGGTIPLGYRVENKKLVVDEKEAEIVRFVFSQYAKGVGNKEILTEMEHRGWRTRRGKHFTMGGLNSLLQNRKYTGDFCYNGKITSEGGCPAIVDRETFEKCAAKIECNKRAPARNKATDGNYLLQGKLFCGMCGSPMVGESGRSRNGNVYHYYACATRKKAHTCHKRNERKDFLEWYVVEQVVTYVLTPERIDIIAQRVVGEYKKSFNTSGVRELERKIADYDHEMDSLVDALVKTSAKAALDKINERIDTVSALKEETEIELAKLKIACQIQLTEDDIKRWLEGFCKGDLFDMDFRQRIIDVFINAIYLYDDKLVIYFNIQDGQQVSYIEMLEDIDGMNESESSDLDGSGPPALETPPPARIPAPRRGLLAGGGVFRFRDGPALPGSAARSSSVWG